jgi:hypothetical protein
MWSIGFSFFGISFVTGTHLGAWHLYVSVPSMVLILASLVVLLNVKEASVRVRGTALTLLLFFFLSALLGWSVFVNTIPALFHGITMGLFGVGALFLTNDLYATESKVAK